MNARVAMHSDDVAMSERQLAVIVKIARIATEDLELRPMLQRIVTAVRDAFGWDFVAYASLDRAGGRFICDAMSSDRPTVIRVGEGRPLGTGVVGEVLMTGESRLLDDVTTYPNYVEAVHGTRSELCVPVRHRGEVLGIINAESIHPGSFAGYLPLLQTVADQVAGAISAGRLHLELQQRADVLDLMSRISRTALQSDQIDEVLQRICSFLRERFDLEFCSILLGADDDADALIAATSARSPDDFLDGGSIWSTTSGIVGRAFRTGELQFAPDVESDPDYVMVDPRVTAELAIPVRHHDRLLGVMNIEADHPDRLSEATREMLCALADQVAGAIHLATVNRKLGETLRLFAEKSGQLAHANDRLRVMNERLERLSTVDGLTGIANRRQFDAALRREWRRACRRRTPLALLLVDIDHFKAYNDGYGHIAGDECLRRVAAALERAMTRPGALVSRYGGEEFAVLLPEAGIDAARLWALRLHEAVRTMQLPHQFGDTRDDVSVCIGYASAECDESLAASELVRRADTALYAAKSGGRDSIRPYEG